MRHRIAGTVALLALIACPTGARAAGDANVMLLGWRNFSGDLADGDSPAFGINVNAGGKKWPIHLDVGWQRSSQVSLFGGDELNVSELALGVRKVWAKEGRSVRPFLAGGWTHVTADFEIVNPGPGNNPSGSDSSDGAYVGGGATWRLGGPFNIGADLRFVFGPKIDSASLDEGLDYQQVGFLLGYGW